MKPAHYCVVRFIADPGRNEQLNIGILAWDESQSIIRIDREAVERVVRENPFLAPDALIDLEPMLVSAVDELPIASRGNPLEVLGGRFGHPLVFSEERFTTFEPGLASAPLEITLNRLLSRVVRPRRRRRGGPNPVKALEKQLKSLIEKKLIAAEHRFSATRTGVRRKADFFANSTANVALDVLRLDLKSADEIMGRADAEAFKIEDILASNVGVKYWVYCDLPDDDGQLAVVQDSTKVLRSVKAEVFTDLETAAKRLASVVEDA